MRLHEESKFKHLQASNLQARWNHCARSTVIIELLICRVFCWGILQQQSMISARQGVDLVNAFTEGLLNCLKNLYHKWACVCVCELGCYMSLCMCVCVVKNSYVTWACAYVCVWERECVGVLLTFVKNSYISWALFVCVCVCRFCGHVRGVHTITSAKRTQEGGAHLHRTSWFGPGRGTFPLPARCEFPVGLSWVSVS